MLSRVKRWFHSVDEWAARDEYGSEWVELERFFDFLRREARSGDKPNGTDDAAPRSQQRKDAGASQ